MVLMFFSARLCRHGKATADKEENISSFDKDTAAKTGQTDRTVRRDAERGEKISDMAPAAFFVSALPFHAPSGRMACAAQPPRLPLLPLCAVAAPVSAGAFFRRPQSHPATTATTMAMEAAETSHAIS